MVKKTKIVIDTNILISAFGWGGLEHKLIQFCTDGYFDLYLSTQIMSELASVLDYPKFRPIFQESSKEAFLNLVWRIANVRDITPYLNVIKDDPSDDRILECALTNKVPYIISGNKHLLRLVNYENVSIMKTAAFLSLFTET